MPSYASPAEVHRGVNITHVLSHYRSQFIIKLTSVESRKVVKSFLVSNAFCAPLFPAKTYPGVPSDNVSSSFSLGGIARAPVFRGIVERPTSSSGRSALKGSVPRSSPSPGVTLNPVDTRPGSRLSSSRPPPAAETKRPVASACYRALNACWHLYILPPYGKRLPIARNRSLAPSQLELLHGW